MTKVPLPYQTHSKLGLLINIQLKVMIDPLLYYEDRAPYKYAIAGNCYSTMQMQ